MTAVPHRIHARMLSAVYGAVTALRRRLYRIGIKRSRHPGVPVIVVGNIVAGGTGKTPLTIAIVQRLRAAGFTPGVASRGHGRFDEKAPRWVDADSDAALSGDEPLLIAHSTGAKVRVDRDRLAAAKALAKAGCDVIVCDDGLQHYRLARDIEIEVVDVRRRYGNGRLLPAGPLREPIERAADCTFRVLNLGVVRRCRNATCNRPRRMADAAAGDRSPADPRRAFAGIGCIRRPARACRRRHWRSRTILRDLARPRHCRGAACVSGSSRLPRRGPRFRQSAAGADDREGRGEVRRRLRARSGIRCRCRRGCRKRSGRRCWTSWLRRSKKGSE